MTGMDFSIHEAENGLVAIDKAREIKPEVIITDLTMPEMGGRELIARVHATEGLNATRVIVLSADRSAALSEELMKAGASDYLIKPVSPEHLKESLMRIVKADL
jgi:YesN/AraC family two-component response regulator